MIVERAKVAEAISMQLTREPDLEKAVAVVALLLNIPEWLVMECVMNEIAESP